MATRRRFLEGGRELTLVDHGDHVDLLIGDAPILTSAALGTERAFGRLAEKLVVRASPTILIGGLGFGSTLRGVLEVASKDATVMVVERLETVIGLVRGELAHLAAGALDDPRVQLISDDVVDVIARSRDLDAILLDVDNGPEWASFPENARLYGATGLLAARAALTPGGSLAVWSGYPADAFLGRLRGAGLRAKVIPFEEHGRLQARAYVGRNAGPRGVRRAGTTKEQT